MEAFRKGLRELGYVEAQTVVLEVRWAEGRFERLPELVAELVGPKVDVLVAVGALQQWRPRIYPASCWRQTP